MTDRHVDHLIVGGGVAGATAAKALRDAGADGSIVVVSRELDPPYHRPVCSKEYLTGAQSREDALVHPASWWDEAGVELLTRTSVLALDPDERSATLSTKEAVSFGTALLATGAMVRRLPVDGANLDGLHYLRAPGNADAIRSDAADAEHVVCVGGSYIGCEVAASLTTLGKRCTIVMQEEEPLSRGFGEQAGRAFRRVLEGHGVEVIGGVDVDAFAGGGERVEQVVLAGGRSLPADMVVCGVGAIPDVLLAKKAGLHLGDLGGVACDHALRSTSHPHVLAAGDMCEYVSVIHGREMRIEHEDVAEQQGAHAAKVMLGADEPYAVVPYFFSDLADWASLEYVGPARDWDEEIVHGSTDEDAFGIEYRAAGELVAYLSVVGGGDLDAARETLAARAQ